MTNENRMTVEKTDRGLKATDKYGDTIIFDFYQHLDENEKRVEILLDNDDSKMRSLLEENDIQVDLSKAELHYLLLSVLDSLTEGKRHITDLSDIESEMVLAYRNGASVEVKWFNETKEDAKRLTSRFGKVKHGQGLDDKKFKWFSSGKFGINTIRATAFYD